MSYLVIGAHKPESCEECYFYTENCGGICRAALFDRGCPLYEIPPHGRLIDADAASEKVNNSNDTALQKLYFDAVLASCPTVIPKEEEINRTEQEE